MSETTTKVNLENPTEVQKAIELLEQKLKAKGLNFKTRQELEAELEDLREKLTLVAEREFERKINQIQQFYGVTLSEDQINKLKENPSSISVLEQVLRENYRKKEIPSGITPLTREQGYITSQKEIPIEKREYPSYEAMISDIRSEGRQDLINKLFEKTLNAIKKGEKSVVFEEPKEAPSIKEQLDAKYFYENIAPKLKAKGLSDSEIDQIFAQRHKKKAKDDLGFKIEPVKEG